MTVVFINFLNHFLFVKFLLETTMEMIIKKIIAARSEKL